MKKLEMIKEINKVMGYEVIQAWESFTWKEIYDLWVKLKTGNYTLEKRGCEYVLVRKTKDRHRISINSPEKYLFLTAVCNEDLPAIVGLGYTPGTAKQYIQFHKAAKNRGESAMTSYSALSKKMMKLILAQINEVNPVESYKNYVRANLEDLAIAEVFNILDATQKLIDDLELERE